ncbi:hypothetical protein BDY19DRAFT_980391 [Irpex rosettiformis]|uniref:Uncharacterized protein n=1 Tax=Irpex rosettiformis TaxID=378272 RepID=A0ACB8TMC9_9APHY|nr:hypothetical protein BDY19DRAFT_980391 [Irpex rosettiformis]
MRWARLIPWRRTWPEQLFVRLASLPFCVSVLERLTCSRDFERRTRFVCHMDARTTTVGRRNRVLGFHRRPMNRLNCEIEDKHYVERLITELVSCIKKTGRSGSWIHEHYANDRRLVSVAVVVTVAPTTASDH